MHGHAWSLFISLFIGDFIKVGNDSHMNCSLQSYTFLLAYRLIQYFCFDNTAQSRWAAKGFQLDQTAFHSLKTKLRQKNPQTNKWSQFQQRPWNGYSDINSYVTWWLADPRQSAKDSWQFAVMLIYSVPFMSLKIIEPTLQIHVNCLLSIYCGIEK